MKKRIDGASSAGSKLLRLFCRLMSCRGRHYQADLARELRCSSQTIIRMMAEIESEFGTSVTTGVDSRRRWYSFEPQAENLFGSDNQMLRWLSLCRDLAVPFMPDEAKKNLDADLVRLSVTLEEEAAVAGAECRREKPAFAFCSRGLLNYAPFAGHLESLRQAIAGKLVCVVRWRRPGQNSMTKMPFAPARFVAAGGTLYVSGRVMKDDFASPDRLCRIPVPRIYSVVLTQAPADFEIPEGDPADFGLPWHRPASFTIRFRAGAAADMAEERIWSDCQKVTRLRDGSLLVEITTCCGRDLLRWVRGFGSEVLQIDLNGRKVSDPDKVDFSRLR